MSKKMRFQVRASSAGVRGFAGIAVAFSTLASASAAHASIYQVYTSSISAMSLNASDGYCSLAEAVASANAGHSMYNCPEIALPGAQDIQLLEAPGKSFSSFHFKTTSLTVDSPGNFVNIYPPSGVPFIDSTGASGLVIKAGSNVSVGGIRLAFTGGASGGRMIENYGTLDLNNSVFSNGNVTPHASGLGGALFNQGSVTEINLCTFQNNKAKRGGAIYNTGTIENLNATISGNSATMAGGGIYNKTSNLGDVNGIRPFDISGFNTVITRNTAPAGGGIFTRGLIGLWASSLTFNTASGSGSLETCALGFSCDGDGGGGLSLAVSSTTYSRIDMQGGSLVTDNKATNRGGGVYSAGQLELIDVTIARNQAPHGGAFFISHSGNNHYCSLNASEGSLSYMLSNTATGGKYSILDWDTKTASGTPDAQTQKCAFYPGRVSASGNTLPTCAPGSGNVCPQ